MDISDIELIRAIVRSGSLSEVSRQMNQSQPTLSRKLQRLEDTLNTQLFHRSARGLAPTEIASFIVSEAEPLDRQLRAIERHVELATQLEAGSVRLGVGPIIEQILVPDALTRFVQTTGNIQVSVITEDDITLLRMFEASELDVVIGPFDVEEWNNKGVVTKRMVGDEIIAVARYDHPVFQYDVVDAEILERYPWAVPTTQGHIQRRQDAVEPFEPKVTADNYDLLRRITIRMDTICAGPRAIFRGDLEGKILREIKVDLGLYWESTLFVRPVSLATPLVKHLVTLCEDVALSLRAETARTN